jgi:predicted nucleic acid-binding Zn ribbon protein
MPEERSSEGQGLGSVLDGLFGARPLAAGMTLGLLARRWVSVVGDRLAEETVPARLDEGGLLLVRASSSAWAAQVTFLSGQIRAAANAALGEERVRRVKVVVGP